MIDNREGQPASERIGKTTGSFLAGAGAVLLSAWVVVGQGESAVESVDATAPGGALAAEEAPEDRGQQALDFEYYRENVEPIFLRDRGGYLAGQTACVNCHTWQATTPLKLETPEEDNEGSPYWTEEQSRRNFEVVSRLVTPGNPGSSRLLLKPLSPEAGGTGNNHTGGTFWDSRDDEEWQALAEWVNRASADAAPRERAPTPDFEFFRHCVQPIFVNPIEGAAACTECHSGTDRRDFANPIPEGREYWSEDQSRQSYAALMNLIEPGYPEYSRFLHHPLHPDAGGDFMHNGGRRWMSKEDPEWQALAEWVRGEARGASCPSALDFPEGPA